MQASVSVLDEPTSGLDTTTAINCLKYLRGGLRGTTRGAIISIHQPNNEMLSLLDNILLLVAGEPIYFGTIAKAPAFFASFGLAHAASNTPATEHYLLKSDVIFGTSNEPFHENYMRSQEHRDTLDEIAGTNETALKNTPLAMAPAGMMLQMRLLFTRLMRISSRDLTLFYLQFAIQSTYGFLVGASQSQNLTSRPFFSKWRKIWI